MVSGKCSGVFSSENSSGKEGEIEGKNKLAFVLDWERGRGEISLSLFNTTVVFGVLLGNEFASNVSSIFLLVSVLFGSFSTLTVRLLKSSISAGSRIPKLSSRCGESSQEDTTSGVEMVTVVSRLDSSSKSREKYKEP